MLWQSGKGDPELTGSAPRPLEQEQMEQAIRAELWKVLDTSDLETITSKEVGWVPGLGSELDLGGVWEPSTGAPGVTVLGAIPPGFPPVLSQSQMLGPSPSVSMGQGNVLRGL